MKNYNPIITMILFFIFLRIPLNAQVLGVPQVIQQETEWCWAATSSSVLQYYHDSTAQCSIAEYTRSVATWHNFGTTNCCTNPALGCNYWNYNWGTTGSIEDILNHFGNIQCSDIGSSLALSSIQAEISSGHPFIFRWAWYSGGGHFLVGYGISGNTIYYMNPLPGYGYEIANYNWVLDDGSSHTWTHTQKILTPCPAPAQPGSISGNANVCKSTLQIYSISAVSGATSYTWNLPSGWSGSSSTNSITTVSGSSSGTISVTANNNCGSSAPKTLSVTVTQTPLQPGIISGSNSVCQGTLQTYSINAVSGATSYLWNLPSGWSGNSTSASISATAGSSGGTISVTARNSCGNSTPKTLNVSIPKTPSQPGTISGNILVCQGSSETYSISSDSGATSYTWILPSGWSGSSTSNSITATAGSSGGTVSVTADNICGSSTPRTLSVNTKQPPSQPGTISGNTIVCQGSAQTYSVSSDSGATSYTWTLPSGWSGSSTFSSIIAIAGSPGGTISVSANNSCGSSILQTLPVNVNPIDASVAVNGSTLKSNAISALYQWVTCPTMQMINGETNQTFSPSQNGIYAVIVKQNSCIDTSGCYPVTVTGLSYISNSAGVVIYPNPTNDLLTVKCTGMEDDNYTLRLTNILGQILNEKELKTTNKLIETAFDMKEFKSGIYFLSLHSTTLNQAFKIQKQ